MLLGVLLSVYLMVEYLVASEDNTAPTEVQRLSKVEPDKMYVHTALVYIVKGQKKLGNPVLHQTCPCSCHNYSTVKSHKIGLTIASAK